MTSIPDQAVSARALEGCRAQFGHGFFPPENEMKAIPGRYGQEEMPREVVVIHLHYSSPAAHWWIAEAWESRDEPGTWEAYGYVSIYPGDTPEWCHVSLSELKRVSLAIPTRHADPTSTCRSKARLFIDRDLGWTPRPAYQCVPGLIRPHQVDVDPASEQGRRR